MRRVASGTWFSSVVPPKDASGKEQVPAMYLRFRDALRRVRDLVYLTPMRITAAERQAARRTGAAGGHKRAANLTPERRSAIAKAASAARWAKKKKLAA